MFWLLFYIFPDLTAYQSLQCDLLEYKNLFRCVSYKKVDFTVKLVNNEVPANSGKKFVQQNPVIQRFHCTPKIKSQFEVSIFENKCDNKDPVNDTIVNIKE